MTFEPRLFVIVALAATTAGCARERYVVTATPLDTGVTSPRLCVALDPGNAHGVWWWEPGRSGCGTRSTGPDVFRAEGAVVAGRNGTTDVHFQLGLHVADKTRPPYADVALVLDRDGLRAVASGMRVSMARRRSLEIPWEPPPAR